MSIHIPLASSLSVPLSGSHVILLNPIAFGIHQTEQVLTFCVALFRGFSEPTYCDRLIWLNTKALRIKLTK